jgi:hypothetical protein
MPVVGSGAACTHTPQEGNPTNQIAGGDDGQNGRDETL